MFGLLLALAGCADGPVSIPTTDANPAAATVCEQFLADLPTVLAGERKRALARNGALGAAWGDPAIVLTCGGDLPDDFDRFSQCVEANGVGWLLEKQDDGAFRFTTTLRKAYIELTIPKNRTGDGLAPLVDLASAVKKAIPEGIAD